MSLFPPADPSYSAASSAANLTPSRNGNGHGRGLEHQRIRSSLQMRWNPVRYATPTRIASELDALYTGRLTIARFWEAMQNRDCEIRTADGKRKQCVENCEWSVTEDSTNKLGNESLAEQQVAILNTFYSGISVTDVLREDMKGGVGLLARQMIDARAKGWAVHELVWAPMGGPNGTLTCSFRQCPLYWYENTEGRLRFLLSDFELHGVDMMPGEWLVTVADNFMEALTGPWIYKVDLLKAWVRFCERYGMPLPVIKTSASKGSAEWDVAIEAAANINEDFALVVNEGANVEFPALDRSGDGTFAKLLEELKRTVITTILGSDLATISAGSGQGQGASLQGREDEERVKSDCTLVSETLNRTVDKFVLEYHFGPGCPILAKFLLVPPKRLDVTSELAVDKAAVEMGVPVGVNDFRERYGRSAPADGDELLSPAASIPSQQGGRPGEELGTPDPALANEAQASAKLVENATREVALARAEDLQSVARELGIILALEDPLTMRNALQNWSLNQKERAKSLIEKPGRLAPAIENLIASSTINGLLSVPSAKTVHATA